MFRDDTSFPFLKIARDRGIDYAEVLACAQILWGKNIPPMPGHSLVSDVCRAVNKETERRRAAVLAEILNG